MSSLQDAFLELLNDAVAAAGSMNRLAHAVGLSQSVISRWMSRARSPVMDAAQPVLDYLHVVDVRFVTEEEVAASASASAESTLPDAERYRAELAEKDKLILKLQIDLARAEGEIRGLDRQLARMMSTPTPVPLVEEVVKKIS